MDMILVTDAERRAGLPLLFFREIILKDKKNRRILTNAAALYNDDKALGKIAN